MKITKRYICIIFVQCAVRTKIKYLRNYLITSGSQSQSMLQTYKQVIFFAFESIKKAIGIFVLPTAIRAVKSKLICLISIFLSFGFLWKHPTSMFCNSLIKTHPYIFIFKFEVHCSFFESFHTKESPIKPNSITNSIGVNILV